MLGTLFIIVCSLAVGVGAGILIGRKNKKGVEKIVTEVKQRTNQS